MHAGHANNTNNGDSTHSRPRQDPCRLLARFGRKIVLPGESVNKNLLRVRQKEAGGAKKSIKTTSKRNVKPQSQMQLKPQHSLGR